MAAITKSELRNRVLRHLGVLAAGEAASSEDASVVDDAIEAAFEELSKYGTVESGFTSNNIPDWAQEPFRDRVAFQMAPAFGIPMDRFAALAQRSGQTYPLLFKYHQAVTSGNNTKADLRNSILRKLRIIGLAEDPSAAQISVAEDLLEDLLDQLRSENAVNFTSTAIPSYMMVPLRDWMAYLMADTFGVSPQLLGTLQRDHVLGLRDIRAQAQAKIPLKVDPVEAKYF